MKKGFLILALVFFSFSLVLAADLPNYTDKYVNDFAGVLSAGQVGELRGLFAEVDQNTTAEIVFVSDKECTSKGGSSQYAIDLLDYWGVGKKDKNNGLLILYCLQENKIFVTTGYGLEGILPDSKIGRLLDENYVPLRDSGNVTQGIIGFSNVVAQVIEDNREEVLSGQAGADTSWMVYLPIIIWGIFFVFAIIMRAKALKKKKSGSSLWWVPIFLPSGGGSGGFGGGGFGGGFGGGGGGGGGAGR